MSVETKSKSARDQFTPVIPEIAEDQKTSYFVKNDHFNKTKTYLKGKEQKEFDQATWRNLNIGGVKMQLHKDVCVTVDQLSKFNTKAKKHWLTERKGAALPKAASGVIDAAKNVLGLGDKPEE